MKVRFLDSQTKRVLEFRGNIREEILREEPATAPASINLGSDIHFPIAVDIVSDGSEYFGWSSHTVIASPDGLIINSQEELEALAGEYKCTLYYQGGSTEYIEEVVGGLYDPHTNKKVGSIDYRFHNTPEFGGQFFGKDIFTERVELLLSTLKK